MEKMKSGMAGAAVVMRTLMAVAGLKLRVNVVGLIPAVENLPGGAAFKPGDVAKNPCQGNNRINNTDTEEGLSCAIAITPNVPAFGNHHCNPYGSL
jgi:leucyl aminopeptidase